MTDGTIGTSSEAAAAAVQRLTQQLDDYCSFAVTPISGPSPVAGSSAHDYDIGGQIRSALDSWRALLEYDTDVIMGADAAFNLLDSRISSSFFESGGQS